VSLLWALAIANDRFGISCHLMYYDPVCSIHLQILACPVLPQTYTCTGGSFQKHGDDEDDVLLPAAGSREINMIDAANLPATPTPPVVRKGTQPVVGIINSCHIHQTQKQP
jgi:hypothetical protein